MRRAVSRLSLISRSRAPCRPPSLLKPLGSNPASTRAASTSTTKSPAEILSTLAATNAELLETMGQSVAKVSTRLQALMESTPDDDVDTSDIAHNILILKPGDCAHVRTPSAAEDAIVLCNLPNKTVVCLMETGEIAIVRGRSAIMAHPGVCDPELASRAILWRNEKGRPDVLNARLEILQQMRQHRKQSDKALYAVRKAATGHLYNSFKQSENFSTTQARDIIRKLLGPQGARFDDNTLLIATFKYLADEIEVYIMSNSQADLFYVRPIDHIQNLRRVNEWARTNDTRIDSFITKARDILAYAEEHKLTFTMEGSDIEPILVPDFTFTEDDKEIITFIQNSFARMRLIQESPYDLVISKIARRLGRANEGHHKFAHTILSDLGIVPSWGDWSAGEVMLDRWNNDHVAAAGKDIVARYAQVSASAPLPKLLDGLDAQRHDWGDMEAYTIDDASAEELDDAISIEQAPDGTTWIHTHIADPTALIDPNDPIAVAARDRTSTVYFSDYALPMFPDTLSSYFSLKGGVSQPVLTFSVKIDDDGAIIDHTVRPGILRNNHPLWYSSVSQALGYAGPTESRALVEPLRTPPNPERTGIIPASQAEKLKVLSTVTGRMIQHRIRNGMTNIQYLSAATPHISPRNLPKSPFPPNHPIFYRGFPSISLETSLIAEESDSRDARQMIAECMMFANTVAGLYGRAHDVPLLYRVHMLQSKHLLEPLRDPKTGFVQWSQDLRSLQAYSGYSVKPAGHDLLGMGDAPYARTTSPLRRYSDLVNHWQIKASIKGSPFPFSAQALKNLGVEVGAMEREIKKKTALNDLYWTSLAIQKQFLKDPEAFRGLKGFVASEARSENLKGKITWLRQVVLPQLGSKGLLANLDKEFAAGLVEGQEVIVDLKEVTRAKNPLLLCVLSAAASPP